MSANYSYKPGSVPIHYNGYRERSMIAYYNAYTEAPMPAYYKGYIKASMPAYYNSYIGAPKLPITIAKRHLHSIKMPYKNKFPPIKKLYTCLCTYRNDYNKASIPAYYENTKVTIPAYYICHKKGSMPACYIGYLGHPFLLLTIVI